MSIKEIKIAELKDQLEALRTMPEGTLLGDGGGRKMKERRRARYVADAQENIRLAQSKPESWFEGRESENLLFLDDLTDIESVVHEIQRDQSIRYNRGQ